MEDKKPIWQSKGVVSAGVAMVLTFLGLIGLGQLSGEKESITQFVMQLGSLAATAFAIYGRIVAKKKLM